MGTFEFSYSDNNAEGRFSWNNSFDKTFESYYLAIDIYQSANIEKALQKFRYILKKHKDFIPVINEIGWHYVERRNFSKAQLYYKSALDFCQNKIPNSFSGIIPWYYLENRHYLRTLQGLGVTYVLAFEFQKGLELLEKNLSLNPNDNQGNGNLLGDVHLLLNDHLKAEEYFKKYPDYWPYRYSYGVLLFQRKQYIESIIQFSKGILEDEYIFKVITNKEIDSVLYENPNTRSDIQDAINYHSFTLPFWFDRKIIIFLNEIFECDLLQIYIEQVNKIRKKSESDNSFKSLKIEHIKKREIILNEMEEYKDLMDEDFALKIYMQIKHKL
ncbi:MAG: hypothetical protein WAT71_10615 [Ignavibacteria bacterium]